MDDALEYLNMIAARAVSYDRIRTRVIDFILNNRVTNEQTVTDLFIMGFLWEAHRREESLTDRDIVMLLDIEADMSAMENVELMNTALPKGHASLSLLELLSVTLEDSDA